jgi:hypothetical protein
MEKLAPAFFFANQPRTTNPPPIAQAPNLTCHSEAATEAVAAAVEGTLLPVEVVSGIRISSLRLELTTLQVGEAMDSKILMAHRLLR